METTTTAQSDWYKCGLNAAAPLWMRVLALISSAATISVGCVSNLTALIAFATNRPLWQFSNINLFLLTVNDLIVTFFNCPHFVVKYWLGCWPLSQYYCNVFTFFLGSAYLSSLVLVALIAYERYLMVKLGALYRQQQSFKSALLRAVPLAIFVPYGSVAILGFTSWYQYLLPPSVENKYIARNKCIPHMNVDGYMFALTSWAFDIVPMAAMSLCYVSVFRRRSAWTNNNQHAVGQALTPATAARRQNLATSSRRAAHLLNALFASILISQLPYMAMCFVMSLIMTGAAPNLDRFYWVSLYELSSIFTMLNNAANPLLYAYTMPDFERAARHVWQRMWKGLKVFGRWILRKQA